MHIHPVKRLQQLCLRVLGAASIAAALVAGSAGSSLAAQPSGAMLLGAYRPEFWQPTSPQSNASISQLGAAIGEPLGIVHWYVGWGTNRELDLDALRSVANRGALPMI